MPFVIIQSNKLMYYINRVFQSKLLIIRTDNSIKIQFFQSSLVPVEEEGVSVCSHGIMTDYNGENWKVCPNCEAETVLNSSTNISGYSTIE